MRCPYSRYARLPLSVQQKYICVFLGLLRELHDHRPEVVDHSLEEVGHSPVEVVHNPVGVDRNLVEVGCVS